MKNTKMTDAKLAEELYLAMVMLAGNQRCGLNEIPERAKIHRELIESSSVNGITSLEHAEKVMHQYRANHPERWNAEQLAACLKSDGEEKKLVPIMSRFAAKGGKARAKSMSAARRKAIAKKAAKTRWA